MAKRDALLLLLAFALSVAVRWPQVNRPLSMHHEYCTAIALTILHNWHTEGYMALRGAPIITFTGAADRYPEGWIEGPGIRDGMIHYLSHPPLAYDLPYLLFHITGTAPNVLGLQLFAIFFHLVAACCLYLAVRVVTGNAPSSAPLFAAVLYLFMPATLWFHGNAYMSDMFVQNFWLMHVAAAMVLFTREGAAGRGLLILFGATLFLAVYTSWLGVFAGAVSVVVAAWRGWSHKNPRMYRAAIVAAMVVLAALLLTAWRYMLIVDPDKLVDYFLSRWAVRGSSDILPEAGHYLRQLAENYRTGFLPVQGLSACLVIWYLWKRKWPIVPRNPLILLVVLTGVPVLLDHLFLLRYAHHDFAALKGAALLCAVAALLLVGLPVRIATVALLLTVLAGSAYFHRINPANLGEAYYARDRDMGLTMARHTEADQAVLCLGFTPEAQVMWYAKRTLFRIDSLEQGRAFLRDQGTVEGVVFSIQAGVLTHELLLAAP